MADGEPGLKIFDNCVNLIKILPKMVRAEYNTEDVKKVDGDDPYDTLRYGYTNVDMHGGRRKKKDEEDDGGDPRKSGNPWEQLDGVL